MAKCSQAAKRDILNLFYTGPMTQHNSSSLQYYRVLIITAKTLALKAGTSIAWPDCIVSPPALLAQLPCFGLVVCACIQGSWSDCYNISE
jgi:hypothetical protein